LAVLQKQVRAKLLYYTGWILNQNANPFVISLSQVNLNKRVYKPLSIKIIIIIITIITVVPWKLPQCIRT
jgi:hypothetical protein